MTDRRRNVVLQAFALAIVAAVITYLIWNLTINLNRMGMGFGMGFLRDRAGFELVFKLTDFNAASTYAYAFWTGLLNTILASMAGIVLATLIGVVVGVARWSRLPVVSDLATVYVELFRNIPMLLQLFFWYFFALRSLPGVAQSVSIADAVFLNSRGLFLPGVTIDSQEAFALFGALLLSAASVLLLSAARRIRIDQGRQPSWRIFAWGLLVAAVAIAITCILTLEWHFPAKTKFSMQGGVTVIPELVALIAALSCYFAAHVAECVRAGLNGVSHGQREAAEALGFPFIKTVRLILLPQAVRTIIPPLANIFLTLVKASALGSAIAYPEILQVAKTTVVSTGQALDVSIILILAFLSINLVIALAMNWFERRYKIVTAND